MTKAERRKRARQRARERAKGSEAPVTHEGVEARASEAAELGAAAQFAAGAEAPDEESEFITGPVVPKNEPARRASPRLDVPRTLIGDEPEEEDDEDEDVEAEGADDDGPEDEEDALFQLACASIEEPTITWNELVTWLLAVDTDDPRLGFLAALLVTEEDTAEQRPLSGERVLAALRDIELDDLVKEAQEAVEAAPKASGDDAEERELIRTSARELAALGKKELGDGVRKAKAGPRHASELRTGERRSESRESKRGGA